MSGHGPVSLGMRLINRFVCSSCSFHSSGIYETGILFGCLRKLERWNLSAILAEVRFAYLEAAFRLRSLADPICTLSVRQHCRLESPR